MAGAVTVLVGTTKGAFLLRSDAGRAGWSLTGPHCDGWPINHVIGDAGDRAAVGGGRQRLVWRRGLAVDGWGGDMDAVLAGQWQDGCVSGA